jgi:hypothetical protein
MTGAMRQDVSGIAALVNYCKGFLDRADQDEHQYGTVRNGLGQAWEDKTSQIFMNLANDVSASTRRLHQHLGEMRQVYAAFGGSVEDATSDAKRKLEAQTGQGLDFSAVNSTWTGAP